MIGFYDYTVILTYLSLLSSVFGMTRAIHGDYKLAIFCLAFSGFCDCFDGKVARTKKNRSEDEKNFGIQLDSLCDVVCFGIFPALICYLLGMRGTFGMAILFVYVICAVIRLAYFNVLEGKRQQIEEGSNSYYHGLPVTSISIFLPLGFLMQFVMPENIFILFLHCLMLMIGILFVMDFQVKKPGKKLLIVTIAVVSAALIVMFLYTRYRLPPVQDDPIMQGILAEEYTS